LLEEGRFHNVSDDKLAKWPIAAKKKKKQKKIHPQINKKTIKKKLEIKKK